MAAVVGAGVGAAVGAAVGAVVGAAVEAAVGAAVGAAVAGAFVVARAAVGAACVISAEAEALVATAGFVEAGAWLVLTYVPAGFVDSATVGEPVGNAVPTGTVVGIPPGTAIIVILG